MICGRGPGNSRMCDILTNCCRSLNIRKRLLTVHLTKPGKVNGCSVPYCNPKKERGHGYGKAKTTRTWRGQHLPAQRWSVGCQLLSRKRSAKDALRRDAQGSLREVAEGAA